MSLTKQLDFDLKQPMDYRWSSDYHWRIEKNLAVLMEPIKAPRSYTEESLRRVIGNINAEKNEYATKAAWLKMRLKYEVGLITLLISKNNWKNRG